MVEPGHGQQCQHCVHKLGQHEDQLGLQGLGVERLVLVHDADGVEDTADQDVDTGGRVGGQVPA